MTSALPSRDEIATRFIDQLPFQPYPLQEEALLAWFASDQGVMLCAPTGTGKTVIAEAALFEALQNGTTAYYTTPLIALTEQKYREMQSLAVKWGFFPEDVGLVTGNRRENPNARVLVVVAEILFNRLLHCESFDFDRTSAVVMDEFHSFNDPERGIVWELTLGLLPPNVRTLLLSATVGNAMEFLHWLRLSHHRKLELVQGEDRKVPLVFQWVPDKLLTEQVEWMAEGASEERLLPALIFCFNREECWSVAETLKGRALLTEGQQARLNVELKENNWSQGAGPKLRQLLLRGVGVHHAGLLPKYRRIVEELFQRKLLSVAVCTETLSAGINLPARSVVVPEILKGPPGKKKVLDPSAAHQMFGRAGRPQYDKQGYVFVLAHEDDVKIARWKDKYDRIPEDTKDPGLMKAKKAMKRKMPKRRETEQYWTEAQFDKLRAAKPGKLYSRGPLPWRLLAYMLDASPEVDRVRKLVSKRLMDTAHLEVGQQDLDQMLMTLWRAGYVTLDPEPPKTVEAAQTNVPAVPPQPPRQGLGAGIPQAQKRGDAETRRRGDAEMGRRGDGEMGKGTPIFPTGYPLSGGPSPPPPSPPPYRPEFAYPTDQLKRLTLFRGVHSLYGLFLVNQLGIANREERIQAMESVLELPRSVGHFVRVPKHDRMPPGPLATTRLDETLLRLGLVTADELTAQPEEDDDDYRNRSSFDEQPKWILTLAEKLRKLFDYDFPGVRDLHTSPVWAAGEVLEFNGDFDKYVSSKSLQKQEGIIFRHLLRLILLIAEFTQLCPPDTTEQEWKGDLEEIAARVTETCRQVDPTSTEKALEQVESEQVEM
ncbi:MAG: DEAD/DEAH box helicase [Thermoguttaceae bacterium]